MRNKLGSAINRRVSGVRLTAEDERALLASVMERKDEIVKKKISVAMVAAAVLIFAAVTCAFAAGMNATPTPTPLAPADDALLVTPEPTLVTPEPTLVAPEPTPVLAFSESEWNDSASDGVVNMKMQYVSVQGAYVTMEVRLTPVQSELVYLALDDEDSGLDGYPSRWSLMLTRDDLRLVLPEELDSGRRDSTIVAPDENGLTFTLRGWLKEAPTDAVRVTVSTNDSCPPLNVSVKCAPNDASTAQVLEGAFDVDGVTVTRVQRILGDDFAAVTIDYTAEPAPIYTTTKGIFMHHDPNCSGMQNATRYDDPHDAQLTNKQPCPLCWQDAADADALFEGVYASLNPGVDVPSDSHPYPISNFASSILNDGTRVTYLFLHIKSTPYNGALQITHIDEDPQILFLFPAA